MESKVAVLLATYCGERFLMPQLRSIARQTHHDWILHASDDGSMDSTPQILRQFACATGQGKTTVRRGPRRGLVANFLSLACDPDISADYYAFCDQDDVWHPEKLERSLAWLRCVQHGAPALYCSRTVLVDADDAEIGISPLFAKPPTFANALVQNIAGGNTMVFNRAACELLRQAGSSVDAVFHDWWTYMLIAGAGGQIFYDPVPSLRYRQHDSNVVGSRSDALARLGRVRRCSQGRSGGGTNVT